MESEFFVFTHSCRCGEAGSGGLRRRLARANDQEVTRFFFVLNFRPKQELTLCSSSSGLQAANYLAVSDPIIFLTKEEGETGKTMSKLPKKPVKQNVFWR